MNVFNFIPEGIEECSVTAWIHTYAGTDTESPKKPAIIICPGGGYTHIAVRESEPVARPYFAVGYNTFILNYSVGDRAKEFRPLCQLAATIAHIRKYSDELNTLGDRIAVCGFSAGGHLAASLGTLYNEPKFLEYFGRTDHIRPDAMILCYPVITSDEYAHAGTSGRVSGAKTGSEEYAWFGLDRHVDAQTPPAFIWHTADDKAAVVENSLKMCLALSNAEIPFEYHVFPNGGHGMSVCTKEVGTPSDYNARWVEWSIEWLNKMFSA